MEETAFLADLFHNDPRPVVFTGAQRSADVSDSDGPRNLIDAITIAGSPAARDLGVLISFNGEVFAAFGTRKTHTLALSAFTADGGRVGHIWNGTFTLRAIPRRAEPLDLTALHDEDTRVDLVPYYPGADVTALEAVVAARSAGVVIEGTGAGNLNGPFCEEIASLTARGVVVALTTRVAYGPVAAIYGAGGGVDAVAAGAVPTGALRASQARILLFALLATGHSVDEVRDEMARRASQNAPSSREAAPTERPIERMRG
jgi:L-asparaginase